MPISRAIPFRIPAAVLSGETADELWIFCLTNAARKTLLAASDRFLYEATWVDESNQRQPLSNEEKQRIEALIAELCGGVLMDDFLESINNLTIAIAGSQTEVCCMSGCNCGCNGSAQSGNQKTIQEIYSNLSEEEVDWLAEILCEVESQPEIDYKCRATNWLVDQWIETNTEFKDANDFGGIVAGILEAIIKAKKWVLKGLTVWLALAEWIVNYFTDSVANAYGTFIIENRQSIVNIIYNADSPRASRAALMDLVFATNANSVVKNYFRAMNYLSTNWDILYIDTGIVPADYPITTPCSAIQPPIVEGYELVPMALSAVDVQNTVSQIDGHRIQIDWDNSPDGFNVSCDVEVVWPSGSVGYLIHVIDGELNDIANHNSVKWDFESSVTVNPVDLEMKTLIGTIFQQRGRDNSESGLEDWVNEVPLAQRDVNAQVPTRDNFNFTASRVGSSTIIGSLTADIYAVVPL